MAKILIVDDDKSIHITIAGILKKEGHEVDVVDDGYSAIESAENSSYDIALIDIRMPGINGVETFRELKKISPETTVIMMTAYAVENLKKEALEEGAHTILNKPFDMQSVINMLEEIEMKNLVLIVDDDLSFRNTVKKNLEKQGFKAVVVESGEVAVNAVQRKQPDIIIVDCKMPGLNGPETIEKINSIVDKSGQNPEVILVSGYDDQKEINRGLALGAKKFLKKPVDMDALKTAIDELVSD